MVHRAVRCEKTNTNHVCTWNIAESDRKRKELKKNNGTSKSSSNIKTDKIYHVIAPSVLFNADIALRTLRTSRSAKRHGLVKLSASV